MLILLIFKSLKNIEINSLIEHVVKINLCPRIANPSFSSRIVKPSFLTLRTNTKHSVFLKLDEQSFFPI
jgi:hypothetical protein